MANRLELEADRVVLSTDRGIRLARPTGGSDAGPLAAGRAACANPQCGRSWRSLLKDRRRPIFEGGWACCSRCLRELVKRAIGRERVGEGEADGEDGFAGIDAGSTVQGAGGEARPRDPQARNGPEARNDHHARNGPHARNDHHAGNDHHHRIPLGLVLLERGWITQGQLRRALDAQRHCGERRIGEWLVEQGHLDRDRVTRGLSLQWGCPMLAIEDFKPAAMALAVPRLLVEALGALPLRVVSNRILYVAFVDRPDAGASFAIEQMSGLKVVGGLSDAAEWAAAERLLGAERFVTSSFEMFFEVDSIARRIAAELTAMQPRASRLVRAHQFYWLRMWLEKGSMSSEGGGIPQASEDVVDRIYAVGPRQ